MLTGGDADRRSCSPLLMLMMPMLMMLMPMLMMLMPMLMLMMPMLMPMLMMLMPMPMMLMLMLMLMMLMLMLMLMLTRSIGLRPGDRWPCGVIECPKNQKPGHGQVLVGVIRVLVGVIRRPGREAGTQARDGRAGFSIGAPGDGGVTFHGTGFQLPGRNDEGNGDVAFPHRRCSSRRWGAAAGG